MKGLIETNIVNKHRAKILTGRRRTKKDQAGQTKTQIQWVAGWIAWTQTTRLQALHYNHSASFPNKDCHSDIADQRKPNPNEELFKIMIIYRSLFKILIIYRSLEERGKLRERLHRGRRAVEGYQEIKQDIKKLTK